MQDLRRQNKLTQKELGHCCGISAQAISRYENGSAEPDIAMMKKIAQLLHTDVNTLVGYGRVSKEMRTVFKITVNEMEMVKAYRQSTSAIREIILELLRAKGNVKKAKD